MTLVPLLPIFHRLNRQFFESSLVKGTQPIVAVRWSDARLRNTAGFYRHKRRVGKNSVCEIVLSSPILENLPLSAIESTLCHEMIHAWIDLVLKVSEGHGPNFYSRMRAINSVQDNFKISVRHQFPVPLKLPKWSAVCPSCGLRTFYKRQMKGVACGHCCKTFYSGKWNSNCILKFEPFLQEKKS